MRHQRFRGPRPEYLICGVLLAICAVAYAQSYRDVPNGLRVGMADGTAGVTIASDGTTTIARDLVFPERADHSSSPTAGYGYVWVKNTTPSTLMYTNDAGTDTTIGAGGVVGNALTSDPLSQFAATTSSQFAGVISDETGSGAVVLATSPTLVTPALGTPSSVTLTNGTGLPLAGLVNITEARLLGRAVGAGSGAATEMTVDQVAQFLYKKTTLASGSSVTWTCTDGIKFKLVLGHNATIQVPSGTPFDGRPAEFLIIQDDTSAFTCAFTTGSSKAFVAGDDFSDTIPAVSSTLSSKSYYKFEYDSDADRFVLMATAVS